MSLDPTRPVCPVSRRLFGGFVEHMGGAVRRDPRPLRQVSLVDAAATTDATTGGSALFLVNRSQTEEVEVTADLCRLGPRAVGEAVTLSDPDPHAANTREAQDRVEVQPNRTAVVTDGVLGVRLPPVSWTAVSLR